MKIQLKAVLAAAGTLGIIGEGNQLAHEDGALRSHIDRSDDPAFDEAACPLRPALG